jgi:hypothetical protein
MDLAAGKKREAGEMLPLSEARVEAERKGTKGRTV